MTPAPSQPPADETISLPPPLSRLVGYLGSEGWVRMADADAWQTPDGAYDVDGSEVMAWAERVFQAWKNVRY